ncbi:hypothetical protein BH10ACI3_BH10ACI3_03490 [soil metagenome]
MNKAAENIIDIAETVGERRIKGGRGAPSGLAGHGGKLTKKSVEYGQKQLYH